MTDRQAVTLRRVATVAAALALLGLGALNLIFRDLLLNWQPAAPDAAWRSPVALLSGAALIITGALLLTPRQQRIGAIIGALSLTAWVVGLHLPAVAAKPSVVTLLGVAEAGAMGLGLATLAVRGGARWIVVGFGACCVVFGLSHFVYAQFTAMMVPGWLPARLAIAYATGAVHAAVGVALLVGWRLRIAALVEAAMMASFVVFLHLPDVVFAPHDRAKWTMLGIASLLTAAAALIASMPGTGNNTTLR